MAQRRKLTDDEVHELVANVRSGMTEADAARKLNVDQASVRYRVTEAARSDLLRMIGWPASLSAADTLRRVASQPHSATTLAEAAQRAAQALTDLAEAAG